MRRFIHPGSIIRPSKKWDFGHNCLEYRPYFGELERAEEINWLNDTPEIAISAAIYCRVKGKESSFHRGMQIRCIVENQFYLFEQHNLLLIHKCVCVCARVCVQVYTQKRNMISTTNNFITYSCMWTARYSFFVNK